MEDTKKKMEYELTDKEIIFSKSIKAGKRIYYLDVKKNRKEELFIAITESKKVILGEPGNSQINYEKHKIFLYKEDFEKFMSGLSQAISYINDKQGNKEEDTILAADEPLHTAEDIKIDIDFE